MHIAVIFIGKSIRYNTIFRDYILRSVKQKISHIDDIITIDSIYKSHLLEWIEKQKSTHLYIFAHQQDFNLISKMISSHLQCELKLEQETLIPKRHIRLDKGSYTVNCFDKKLNIVQIAINESLPKILLREPTHQNELQIFGFDKEELSIILEPIADIYNISLHIQEVVKDWQKVYIKSSLQQRQNFIQSARQLVSNRMIVDSDVVPYMLEQFDKKNIFVAFAESCTGGLLSAYFTKYPKISHIFELGVVSYSNEIKANILEVSKDNLFQKGAVSHEVISDMLTGILQKSQATYALAISGIAGPDGGSEDKPVGTVGIGVATHNAQSVEFFQFQGDRILIQQQSVLTAIKMLIVSAQDEIF